MHWKSRQGWAHGETLDPNQDSKFYSKCQEKPFQHFKPGDDISRFMFSVGPSGCKEVCRRANRMRRPRGAGLSPVSALADPPFVWPHWVSGSLVSWAEWTPSVTSGIKLGEAHGTISTKPNWGQSEVRLFNALLPTCQLAKYLAASLY